MEWSMVCQNCTDCWTETVLLERIFLSVGSFETNKQLQNVVSKFLPLVLRKLSSQEEDVRKKKLLWYSSKISLRLFDNIMTHFTLLLHHLPNIMYKGQKLTSLFKKKHMAPYIHL